VMNQLIETGHVQRAVMGVSIRAITPEDAEYAKLRDIRGVVVNGYTDPEKSPARRAGIQPGDIIVAVDSEAIESVSQLQQRVGFRKPGETIQVTVVREDGARRTIPVRLAEAPTGEDALTAQRDERDGTRERGESEEALGISVEPLSQEDARDPGLRAVQRSGGGLVVTQVSPEGPAYGKLVDARGNGYPDIILKVNNQATRTRAELRAAVADVKSGEIVTLNVLTWSPDDWVPRVVRLRAR
ncbi:MAG: PDZ domain-containing protein, partial [Gemmatimonadales bacterium]